MAKQELEDTGIDPETAFNEGRELGINEEAARLHEQIEQMAAAGMHPDEIEQALFSGDTDIYRPGRRPKGRGRGGNGRRKCSAKQWAKMPQICRGTGGARVRTARHPVMVYDPAPRPRSRYRYRTAAKKAYGGAKARVKAEKTNLLIGGGAVLAALYAKYSKRVTALKAMGAVLDGKPVDSIWKALMYDIKNRPTTPFMDRLGANAMEIATPIVGGVVAPYLVSMIPKVPEMVKNVVEKGSVAAIGYGVGNLIGTALDDINRPVSVSTGQQNTNTGLPTRQNIRAVQSTGMRVNQQPININTGSPTGIQVQPAPAPATGGSWSV